MSEEEHKAIRDEHYRQLNSYRDDPAYQTLDGYEARAAFFARRVGTRWEIDEAIFDEFLDMLPPLGWRGDSFYMSEFLFDDITHRYLREGGRFFCEVACYPPRPQRPSVPAPSGRNDKPNP